MLEGGAWVEADEPEEAFLKAGYRPLEQVPILERAAEFGLVQIPQALLRTSFRLLVDGYAVYAFEAD